MYLLKIYAKSLCKLHRHDNFIYTNNIRSNWATNNRSSPPRWEVFACWIITQSYLYCAFFVTPYAGITVARLSFGVLWSNSWDVAFDEWQCSFIIYCNVTSHLRHLAQCSVFLSGAKTGPGSSPHGGSSLHSVMTLSRRSSLMIYEPLCGPSFPAL